MEIISKKSAVIKIILNIKYIEFKLIIIVTTCLDPDKNKTKRQFLFLEDVFGGGCSEDDVGIVVERCLTNLCSAIEVYTGRIQCARFLQFLSVNIILVLSFFMSWQHLSTG